jgi:hypothetical protein
MQQRVLLITALSKPWNNGWYYKTGLEKNGHIVFPFDPSTSSDPLSEVFKISREFKPGIILHTKNELPAELFQELKQFARIVQWYPDLAVPDWLPPYIRTSDIFFTMSEGRVQEFTKYNSNVFWLSQGFEPSFFLVNTLSPEDKRTFSSEVAFVGNLGSKQYYLRRRACLKKVIREGFDLKWWGPRIPRKISTIPLLFGKLGRAYGGRFVWGKEYAKIAKLSKIFLALDALPHIRKSMSARMYTAVGCGSFYMCQHVNGIEEVLEPGKEIITFKSDQEMPHLIRYYLKNDSLRTKIAEAGKMKVLQQHTYEIRIRQMFEVIEKIG